MCTAVHLIRRGEYHGYTEDEMRQSAVCLGVVGTTVDGVRYVALPSHEDQLQPWAEFHASVMRYHQAEADKEWQTSAIELDDWDYFAQMEL